MKTTDKQKELIKTYEHLFNNTGGDDVLELLERTDINLQNNVIATILQSCCGSQLKLLETLEQHGLLLAPESKD
jgi:hypothetical protein